MKIQKNFMLIFVHYGICANASEEVKPMIQSLFAERLVFEDVKNVLNQFAEKGVDFAIGSNTEVYKPNPKFYETILDRSGWSVDDYAYAAYRQQDLISHKIRNKETQKNKMKRRRFLCQQ